MCVQSMSSSEKQQQTTSFESLHSAAAKYVEKENPSQRNLILDLGVDVGNLCSSFLMYAPLDPKREPLADVPNSDADQESFWQTDSEQVQAMTHAMSRLLCKLVVAAEACNLNLGECILKKMLLNEKKYPVELAKGKSGKYTQYSAHTGITKTKGQSTQDYAIDEPAETIEEATSRIRHFATERHWARYHSPRNLVLAIMGELGELAELFQWRGDHHHDDSTTNDAMMERWSQEERDHAGQEFADVAIYLLRLADVCYASNIGVLALSHCKAAI